MLKNYLVIAFRNLYKTRLYSSINIIGLSVGMAICIMILGYINFQLSYDKFHENSDRIYRIRYERYSEDGESVRFASCAPPVGLRIRTLFPEVENVTRIFRFPTSISYNEKKFIEEKVFFAEKEFFEIFDFNIIEGNAVKSLSSPNTAFISQSTAKKYFGDENPIGKSLRVDQTTEFEVTGIFVDVPLNSHIKFDIVFPWENLLQLVGRDYDEAWGHSGAYTYVLIKENTSLSKFQEKLDEVAEKEFGEILKEYKLSMKLPIQPLTEIHLNSHFQQEFEANGDKTTINLLMIVAVFIIVIAWVNYVNLSTARSLTRAKEVGLRKVVGASKTQLMSQFLIEVIIINSIAILLSLFLVEFFQPIFFKLTGVSFVINIWESRILWIALVAMFFVGIFLSGLYPITILSSFSPINVLRGKLGSKPKGVNLRKILVVFQFSMALVLATCTFAVYKQVNYMRKLDLGFSMDQVLAVRGPRVKNENFVSNTNSFRQEILRVPIVSKMCILTEVPGRQIYWDAGGIHPVGSDESKNYQIVGIDYEFVDLFETKIIEGRNFSKDFPSDTLALILNETAVKWMGFASAKECIGKQVDYWETIYTIVGVMKDFHQQSPKFAFEPHIYRLMPFGRGNRSMFAFKLEANDPQITIKKIQQLYDYLFPGNPFEYFFINDYYDQQYKDDLVLGKVFGLFSILAIIVTSLGVLGLFSFMVSQRTKEISIRIVLGANPPRVLFLFAKEFLNLIIISFFITVPICFFSISYWLRSFSERMQLSFWLFILPLIILLAVAALTISSLVIKAALANPAENLKYE